MKSSILLNTFGLVQLSIAGYVLEDDYSPSSFLDGFTAFSGPDPTSGFVKLVTMDEGKSTGLISAGSTSVKLASDSTNVTPSGRPSIRLESVKSYNSGLIIADLAHMPGSICGAWPAFWTIGPDWPANGEIDIIEGVNSATSNSMTLHTAPGCSISNSGQFNGLVKTSNCDINASGEGKNVGCQIAASGSNTYGDSFNSVGGGVYATEWTPQGISVFHFARSAIPADIASGNPDPSGWGEPLASFQGGGCDYSTAFKNQTIVFDTTFCGQWAGQQDVWSSDPVCGKKAATCNDYVQNNPKDFAEAYWEINSVKVYQLGDSSTPAPVASSPAAPPAAASSSLAAPAAPSSPASAVPAAPSSPASAAPAAPSSPAPADGSSYATTASMPPLAEPSSTQSLNPAPAIVSPDAAGDEYEPKGGYESMMAGWTTTFAPGGMAAATPAPQRVKRMEDSLSKFEKEEYKRVIDSLNEFESRSPVGRHFRHSHGHRRRQVYA
ncbi:hypothetical protein BT63DRAFT_408399 [Microthyrium microscopicum]|uniref:endo-1,3(4)-beta-glucanase n=1 Tax=Microthyrium microscopicum TaxID=703497 RepID=A0A6A6US25_9PEZI|nr:hypothetical protein BT63DRAFT_408399 [Microthyrium microscopicum]